MKMRKWFGVLLALALLALSTVCAFAVDTVDLDRLGSIRLTLRYEGRPITGGDLVLYRVADVVVENGYDFALVPELADSEIALDDLSAAHLADELRHAVAEAGIKGVKKAFDEQGRMVFDDLPVGLYLLMQENPAPEYEPLAPFLVSVPMNEDGAYLYDVDASPKPSPERTPTPPPPPPPDEPELPLTGQLKWPVPVMAVSGLICLAGGCILLRGGRKEERS